MEKHEEYRDSFDKFKEIPRLQHDYFKHVSTLSLLSIGTILTFIVKIMPGSKCIILAGLSLLCFIVCLIFSLYGMTDPINIVLYITGIQMNMTIMEAAIGVDSENKKEKNDKLKKDIYDLLEKNNKCTDRISKYGLITRYSFMIGVVIFLMYAGINFLMSDPCPGR